MKISRSLSYIKNIILPCLILGCLTGILVSVIIIFFKWVSGYVIQASEIIYVFLRNKPLFIIPAFMLIIAVAALSHWFYRWTPDSKGGGIPTSIAILRGIVSFKWLRNLIGVISASLVTFLFGIPLGNEGPCVQIGTAVGRGVSSTVGKNNKAWDRYVMTGGACAGFSVATGAPISGIFFAIEEAHQRLSPMIIMVATTTVMFASAFSELMCGVFGISPRLFEIFDTVPLSLSQIWIPAIMGFAMGLFSIAFMMLGRAVTALNSRFLKNRDISVKIFITLLITFALGLISYSFLGTGHKQIEQAVDGNIFWLVLIIIILLRAFLMLFANKSGATGGMFVPILALGAMFSAIMADMLLLLGVPEHYYATIVLLGVTACLAAMVKIPVTAVVFAMEALSLSGNILHIITSVTVAFMITEIAGMKSINEAAMENRVKQLTENQRPETYGATVKVRAKAFAVGKAVRDIFWPHNLFVLSVRHGSERPEVDEHGAGVIREGDELYVRFTTSDYDNTISELKALVGEQVIDAVKTGNDR